MAAAVPDRRRRASITGITGQDGSSQRTRTRQENLGVRPQVFSLDHTLIRSAAERNSEK
jgi:hypothetical protein